MESQSETTQTVSALKLLVIVNSDLVSPVASASAGAEGPSPPKTAEQKLARKNKLKAKSTLMLAIPDKHLLKFHACKDAKSLWEAIKNRFGGTKESKKMQKTILKQNYINFAASIQKGLDKTYDRFQKLISQLEIHGEVISQEDANMKLLRSLPSAWDNIALIMRNKSNLDTLSMYDLYNNLKVYESEIKVQSGLSLNSHNVAFVTLYNSRSINKTINIAHIIYAASSKDQASSASYADDVMFSFFTNQSNAPQLDNEDLEQIDTDDIEEMDLKWQVAMLIMRVKRFIKRIGRKLDLNGKETVSFDRTKIDLLVQQYKQFVISEDESIGSAFARFNTIITSLKALDEGYSSKNYVRKFLRSLHPKLKAKVTAIEESKDLTSLSLDKLIRNLKVHKMIIKKDSEIVKAKVERKSLTLKAKKESSDEEFLTSDGEDEKYAMAIRVFKKFFKRRECPKPPKDKNQRAFIEGSWSDSGEEDDEKVKNKTCLVAQASSEICLGVDFEPDEWIKDNGCSKHITGNRKLFSSYTAYKEGSVIFCSNLRDNIIGKGQVRHIRHEEEIDVQEYQVLTREIEPTLKPLEEIIRENVFCLGGNRDDVLAKDRGMRRGRHSTSSSTFNQQSSSHLNDDDGIDEGTSRASTPSSIRYVSSLTNKVPQVFQNPPNIDPHLEPFYTRQNEIINHQVQIQDEHRGGLRQLFVNISSDEDFTTTPSPTTTFSSPTPPNAPSTTSTNQTSSSQENTSTSFQLKLQISPPSSNEPNSLHPLNPLLDNILDVSLGPLNPQPL
nr:hypothetical protein [Tanacetum cinerariifolium]